MTGRGTAEEDVGRVVARAVSDPRTADKRLIIHAASPTQNQLVAAFEAVSGRKLLCEHVTRTEMEEELKGGWDHMIASKLGNSP